MMKTRQCDGTVPVRRLMQEDLLRTCSSARAWKMLCKWHLEWEGLGKMQAGNQPMQRVWSWLAWGTGRGWHDWSVMNKLMLAGCEPPVLTGAASGVPKATKMGYFNCQEMAFTVLCSVWEEHSGLVCLFSYAFSITCQGGNIWGKSPKR